MKRLRLWAAGADGQPVPDATEKFYPTDPETGVAFLPVDGVFILVRRVSPEDFQAFVRARTTHIPDPKRGELVQQVDRDAVDLDVLRAAIVSWDGFASRDGAPLPCTDATKALLNPLLRRAVNAFALECAVSEEVTAASFREPARVVPVVGGPREGGAVLPAGDA